MGGYLTLDNLFLPEVDLAEVPDFRMKTFSFWSLANPQLEEYRFLEQAFNPNEIKEILKLGKSFKNNQSRTGDGREFSEVRKSYNSWIPPCDITNWLYVRAQDLIANINTHFEFDLHSMENFQFTEYDDQYNGMYQRHIDKFPNATSPNSHRKLSFSVQLSDPATYEGGDLLMHTGDKPMVANRAQGSINFFPSYVLHEVTPVTKGKRYSLVGWVSGPKFK